MGFVVAAGIRLKRLVAGDFVGAFPAIAVYLAYIHSDVSSLRQLVTERIGVCKCADVGLAVAVAARVATLMSFGLLVILFAIRRPAVSGDGRVAPNLAGLAGFCLPCLFAFLVRAPAEVGFNVASSVIVFVGNAGVVLTLSHLGRSLSILPQARRLVTSGPYALVRHPLYFFEILAFWGVFLQFRSIEAAALVVMICCVQFARARFEERVLGAAFPDYSEYKRAVPLLVPRIAAGAGAHLLALRQSGPHLIALVFLFATFFTIAVTVLPGHGWRVVQEIAQPEVPSLTIVSGPYGSRERCDEVAKVMADNARRACPQCTIEGQCTDYLAADQEAAVAGRQVEGSVVRSSTMTYLLPPGPDGRTECYALAGQLRSAGSSDAECRSLEPVR